MASTWQVCVETFDTSRQCGYELALPAAGFISHESEHLVVHHTQVHDKGDNHHRHPITCFTALPVCRRGCRYIPQGSLSCYSRLAGALKSVALPKISGRCTMIVAVELGDDAAAATDVGADDCAKRINLTGKCDGCDCRGQDLRTLLSPTNGGPIKITLNGTNLADANLAGVDLSGSMLTDCSLRGANLKGAKLDRAMIRGCDLSSADLTEARRDDAAMTQRLHGDDAVIATL